MRREETVLIIPLNASQVVNSARVIFEGEDIPEVENTKEAMNDDSKTSATPYCCVVSMRSRENAIPGRTLRYQRQILPAKWILQTPTLQKRSIQWRVSLYNSRHLSNH